MKADKIKELREDNNYFSKLYKATIKNKSFVPPEVTFQNVLNEYTKQNYKLNLNKEIFKNNPLLNEDRQEITNHYRKCKDNVLKLDPFDDKYLNFAEKLNFISIGLKSDTQISESKKQDIDKENENIIEYNKKIKKVIKETKMKDDDYFTTQNFKNFLKNNYEYNLFEKSRKKLINSRKIAGSVIINSNKNLPPIQKGVLTEFSVLETLANSKNNSIDSKLTDLTEIKSRDFSNFNSDWDKSINDDLTQNNNPGNSAKTKNGNVQNFQRKSLLRPTSIVDTSPIRIKDYSESQRKIIHKTSNFVNLEKVSKNKYQKNESDSYRFKVITEENQPVLKMKKRISNKNIKIVSKTNNKIGLNARRATQVKTISDLYDKVVNLTDKDLQYDLDKYVKDYDLDKNLITKPT